MWYRLLIPSRLFTPLGYLNLMIHHNVTALIKSLSGLCVAPLKEHLKQNGSCGQEEEEEEGGRGGGEGRCYKSLTRSVQINQFRK